MSKSKETKISVRVLEPRFSWGLRTFIASKLKKLADRWGHQCVAIEAVVRDTNGPRGGSNAIECLLVAKAPGQASWVIRERGDQPYAVAVRAEERLRRLLSESFGGKKRGFIRRSNSARSLKSFARWTVPLSS